MPIYVHLVNFTDQGIKTFRDTVGRAEDFRGRVEQSGGQVRQQLWTLGQYDVLVVTEFPDDETATARGVADRRRRQHPHHDHEGVRRRADVGHHSAGRLATAAGRPRPWD
jgi:uncharacterized protein with GYD domain